MSEERLARSEVVRVLGVSEEFLLTLEQAQVVRPDPSGRYTRRALDRVRICWNLQRELDVNVPGQEVILHLLDRLERERAQFREVLAYLQGRLNEPQ
ncbi:MAG TPA: hypothetical protein DEA08_05430 [Planctomycetes bacterium]|nr:hypothetical protein [Planctomycetota bacterium]|tara:strand:+ start:397 stop:687 length:291 start_codon:yes stop_codon:yes gene_type:complete